MATRKSAVLPSSADTGPPPPTTPNVTSPAYGAGDHSFTLQAIMEMQKTLGELKASIDTQKSSIDGLKTKVDDLVGWKNMSFGGAAVLGAIIAAFAFIVGKTWDYVSTKAPIPQATQQVVPAPPTLPQSVLERPSVAVPTK